MVTEFLKHPNPGALTVAVFVAGVLLLSAGGYGGLVRRTAGARPA